METLLGNWLEKHIQEVDMGFAAFVRERSIDIPDDA
jgi:hypothetical protein